jgi:hypothetical protein
MNEWINWAKIVGEATNCEMKWKGKCEASEIGPKENNKGMGEDGLKNCCYRAAIEMNERETKKTVLWVWLWPLGQKPLTAMKAAEKS